MKNALAIVIMLMSTIILSALNELKLSADDQKAIEEFKKSTFERLMAEKPFKFPPVTQKIELKIRGKVHEGYVYKVTPSGVWFGDEDSRALFAWEVIDPKSLSIVSEKAYANLLREKAEELTNVKKQEILKRIADEAEAQKKKQADIEKRRHERLAQNNAHNFRKKFESSWDGSFRPVVNFAKENMKDPSSFEHVRSELFLYNDSEDMVLIEMTYRGENSFGGKVIGRMSAVCNSEGKVVKILKTEN